MNNDYRDYLMHHGIKDQKWGVRRYQNEDGSLTSAGEARYRVVGRAREKNVTGTGNGVYKRGNGLGSYLSERQKQSMGFFTLKSAMNIKKNLPKNIKISDEDLRRHADYRSSLVIASQFDTTGKYAKMLKDYDESIKNGTFNDEDMDPFAITNGILDYNNPDINLLMKKKMAEEIIKKQSENTANDIAKLTKSLAPKLSKMPEIPESALKKTINEIKSKIADEYDDIKNKISKILKISKNVKITTLN